MPYPFDASEFNFVFLTTTFTDMLADDYRHYLDEISRVLMPGRTCFASMFLINDGALAGITSARSNPGFRFRLDGLSVDDAKLRKKAVAYSERDGISDFEARGMQPGPFQTVPGAGEPTSSATRTWWWRRKP